jgi:hypothetical protein
MGHQVKFAVYVDGHIGVWLWFDALFRWRGAWQLEHAECFRIDVEPYNHSPEWIDLEKSNRHAPDYTKWLADWLDGNEEPRVHRVYENRLRTQHEYQFAKEITFSVSLYEELDKNRDREREPDPAGEAECLHDLAMKR